MRMTALPILVISCRDSAVCANMDDSGASDRGTAVQNLEGTSFKNEYDRKRKATGNSCKDHIHIPTRINTIVLL